MTATSAAPADSDSNSVSSSTPQPPVVAWTVHGGDWVRATPTSQACVNTGHQWSAISTVYGYAHGQAADHTSAMNAVRAVLRAWGEHPLSDVVDDEHHDDIWPRPPAPGTWPNTPGRAAMR